MKLFLKFGLTLLLSIVLTFYIIGCVETDNPAISTVDQRTNVKFVNLSNLGTSMNVNIDGNSVAAVSYGAASSYLDLAAGTRTFVFAYGTKSDTVQRALDPNAKFSVFSVYEPLNGDLVRTYYFSMERQTYSGSVTYVPQKVLVRFLNLTNDTTATNVNVVLSDTSDHSTTVAIGGNTAYIQSDLSANPSFVINGRFNNTLVTKTLLSAEGRYAVVLSGNKVANSLHATVFKED
ncbi:MAG: hypothetical protein NTX44_01480 [Ignavibacteriales bacterium]|nr:hypothetical protein [Ignavibacteriales bacterium]